MKILITAGPTREPLDPVRFLSNASTGAMGVAIANALCAKNSVTVISGPAVLPARRSVKKISVTTAAEMNRAVMKRLRAADVFIATAAVSDWRFKKTFSAKMKKGRKTLMQVALVRNPDILFNAGLLKKRGKIKTRLVGFCLETSRVELAARAKLRAKNLDLIVGNKPESFGSAKIRPYWLENKKPGHWLPSMNKTALAKKIARWIYDRNR